MSDAPPIAPPPGLPDDRPRGTNGSGAADGPGIVRGPDRVPPHSLEAEVSVLGSCLISKDAVVVALELLKPDDFYRNAHRVVFEAVQALSEPRRSTVRTRPSAASARAMTTVSAAGTSRRTARVRTTARRRSDTRAGLLAMGPP